MAEIPTSFDTITVTVPAPHICVVTLDRPEAANAFNTRMAEELTGVFEALNLDPGDTRVVVLTGAGGDSILCRRRSEGTPRHERRSLVRPAPCL